jgi:GGDEF domain-containing protein
VVVFSNHLESHCAILELADAAMYLAKESGRNSIQFYDLKD